MTALSLEQQISRKCIHFNGVMNETCKAGIKYADVRGGGPLKCPCLSTGGFCIRAEYPSPEEVKARVDEIEGRGNRALKAAINIKAHFNTTKERNGTITCECGGLLRYAIADNGHARAYCKSCGLSFIE